MDRATAITRRCFLGLLGLPVVAQLMPTRWTTKVARFGRDTAIAVNGMVVPYRGTLYRSYERANVYSLIGLGLTDDQIGLLRKSEQESLDESLVAIR